MKEIIWKCYIFFFYSFECVYYVFIFLMNELKVIFFVYNIEIYFESKCVVVDWFYNVIGNFVFKWSLFWVIGVNELIIKVIIRCLNEVCSCCSSYDFIIYMELKIN